MSSVEARARKELSKLEHRRLIKAILKSKNKTCRNCRFEGSSKCSLEEVRPCYSFVLRCTNKSTIKKALQSLVADEEQCARMLPKIYILKKVLGHYDEERSKMLLISLIYFKLIPVLIVIVIGLAIITAIF